MKRFDNRIAIVTGASQGIGRAIALALAGEGASVVVTARNRKEMEKVSFEIDQAGGEAIIVPANLRYERDINTIAERAVTEFGSIDILVNNAALIHPVIDLIDLEAQVWRQVIEVNLTAPALLTKAVLPHMIANRSGKIINISSIGGRRGAKGRTAYRASKAGLINLTESIAAEVKQYGIDVNCICPSGTDTEGYRENIEKGGRQANPKLMLPKEIAEIVLFLASDASSAITGTAIDAFGGTNPLFN